MTDPTLDPAASPRLQDDKTLPGVGLSNRLKGQPYPTPKTWML